MKKLTINLIGFILITACTENEKLRDIHYSLADKSVNEYRNGEKLHYREFDSKENELLHIYYNDEVEEKTISKYDTAGIKLTELVYRNDSLMREVKYKYEFDNQQRPLKITAKFDSLEKSKVLRYLTNNDTLITTYYQSQEDFQEGRWLRKSFTDENEKLYRMEYNEIYGGGGEKIINHFTEDNLIDYQIHFYMGFDTTYYQYNEKNKIVRTERKSRDRENYRDYEYDAEGNRARLIITEIIYYQGDTLVSDWIYKWENIKK